MRETFSVVACFPLSAILPAFPSFFSPQREEDIAAALSTSNEIRILLTNDK